MVSGYGRPAHGGRDNTDGLDAMDDADIADLWVVDEHTGEFRMRTTEEQAVSAAESVVVDPDEDAEPRPRRRTPAPPRKPKSKLKKRLKWTAISLAALLVVLAGAAYGYYEYLNSRIKTDELSANDEGIEAAPPDAEGRTQMNILLIGSDNRMGEGNEGYGAKDKPGAADTVILMHLSADRSNATMVSIPRDTFVYRPSCRYTENDQEKVKPAADRVPLNSTMEQPLGPGCTVATVQRMLGVKIDHFVMIEFKGVKAMTSAVGGVPITLCDPLDDPVLPNQGGGTDLHLTAGEHRLQGEDALRFLRVRHGFYMSSDLARIEAQKAFLMALAREVKSNAKWNKPQAMLEIAQAATGNLTVDNGLNRIEKLVGLGNEIKKVPEKRMAFTTLPVEDVPEEVAAKRLVHVQPREPKATNLWTTVRNDVPLTEGDASASPAPSSAAPEPPPATTAPAAPAVDPATVKVSVRNTTKTPRAQAVVTQLKALRYKATLNQAGGTQRANSAVVYPKGQIDAAKQLAAAVGLSETALDESPTATAFEIVIGLDFPAPGQPSTGASAPGGQSPPPAQAAPPSKADLKLNTADNTACIKTNKSK